MLLPLVGVAKSFEIVRFMSCIPAAFVVNVALCPVPPASPEDRALTMTTRVASLSAPYSVIGVEPAIETTPRYVPGLTRM